MSLSRAVMKANASRKLGHHMPATNALTKTMNSSRNLIIGSEHALQPVPTPTAQVLEQALEQAAEQTTPRKKNSDDLWTSLHTRVLYIKQETQQGGGDAGTKYKDLLDSMHKDLHAEAKRVRDYVAGCVRFDVMKVTAHGPKKLDSDSIELIVVQTFTSKEKCDAYDADRDDFLKGEPGLSVTTFIGKIPQKVDTEAEQECYSFSARWQATRVDAKQAKEYTKRYGTKPLDMHVKKKREVVVTPGDGEAAAPAVSMKAEDDTTRRVGIVVFTEVKEERHRLELIELMKKVAIESCGEPGCLQYHVLQDRANPNAFLFFEVYASEADFEHHKALPHTKEWGKFKFRDLPPPKPPPDWKAPENPDNPIVAGAAKKYPPTLICEMMGDQYTWWTVSSVRLAVAAEAAETHCSKAKKALQSAEKLGRSKATGMMASGGARAELKAYYTTVKECAEEFIGTSTGVAAEVIKRASKHPEMPMSMDETLEVACTAHMLVNP